MRRWQRTPHCGDARPPPQGHSSICWTRWKPSRLPSNSTGPDRRCARRPHHRAVGTEEWLRRGPNQRMARHWRATSRQMRVSNPKLSPLPGTGASKSKARLTNQSVSKGDAWIALRRDRAWRSNIAPICSEPIEPVRQNRPSVAFQYTRFSPPENWWSKGTPGMPLIQNDDVAVVAKQLGPQFALLGRRRKNSDKHPPRSLMPSLRLASTRCICRARSMDLRCHP